MVLEWLFPIDDANNEEEDGDHGNNNGRDKAFDLKRLGEAIHVAMNRSDATAIDVVDIDVDSDIEVDEIF